MRTERICPICGGNIEYCDTGTDTDIVYGVPLSMKLACDNPKCGFGLAFPFDSEVYVSYVCEEIRFRTRKLPSDARARALLQSLSHCRRDASDPLSKILVERVNVIFMEALGEILKKSREMLKNLSYREPNELEKAELRRRLREFLRFLKCMEGHYPTERLEKEFRMLEMGLSRLDYHYELGMLAREEGLDAADLHFADGALTGGIRSRLAYVKYVMTEQAETETEGKDVKRAYAEVATVSQEACYEYLRSADLGTDEVLGILSAYLQTTYPTLSIEGKLSFLRLLLSSGTERYEPTLAALQAMPVQMSRESEERSERILCEFEAIVRMVSEECDALISSIDALGGLTEYSGDLASAHAAAEEENTIVEYLIGCAMYYRSMTDEDLRFDLSYLRKAFGHFSAFLSSELVSGDSDTPFDLPSLIGFRDLRTLCENARRYRAALSDSVGIGSGEV